MTYDIDLFIHENDIVTDVAGMPKKVSGHASIAQDMKHMILEEGLLVPLIAERSDERWQMQMNTITEHVEQDIRIIAGTVSITRTDTTTLTVHAQTHLRDTVSLALTIDQFYDNNLF